MYDRILVRYGDLTLKGRNKRVFLEKVNRLVRKKMTDLNVKYDYRHDRLYVLLNGEDYKEVINRLNLVSGLSSYSLVARCENNIEDIKALSLKVIESDEFFDGVTFKVESRRSDKSFYKTSPIITKEVASYVLSNSSKKLIVDVHKPKITLHVQVRKEGTFVYTTVIKGMGGFPVSVAGKGLLMISGGIDSPVAGYLAMKQGIEIECIHYESTPLTSIESAQKVVDLVKILSKYAPNNRIKIHMIPFMEIHKELLEHIPESYNITIMRRMMYRIAEKIAQKNQCMVLINGESVGQVASQTLESMSVINETTNMPVLRPLVTYDKLNIIDISRKIGAYQTSIKPFEDCCTVYVPKNPSTKPKLDKCIQFEKRLDVEGLIEDTVNRTKYIIVKSGEELDLTLFGLTVREVIDGIKENKNE